MDILTLLENSLPALWVRNWIWAFPLLEIVHLSGLTLVFGGMVMLDLRLLGFSRDRSVKRMERLILPFVWRGFAVAAISGAWLFIYQANKLSADEPFLLKILVLLPLAGLNALFMHKIAQRDIDLWDVNAAPPLLVRASAVFSLALWIAILASGRLIAYFYPYPM